MDDKPIIIGAGLAGLMAALHLAPSPCWCSSAAPLGEQAASAWAQGGLAAAIGDDDTTDLHLADTLAAGDGLCDAGGRARDRGGRRRRWSRNCCAWAHGSTAMRKAGSALGLEAGHGRRRIVHAAGDASGREILRAVIAAVRADAVDHDLGGRARHAADRARRRGGRGACRIRGRRHPAFCAAAAW